MRAPSVSPARKRPRAKRLTLRLFGKDRSGTAAVEFAIIATPFFALLFALIEIGLVFFGGFTLENAVEQASRMIKTGQAQQQGFSESRFKEEICDNVHALFDCENGLKLDVRKFDTFGGVNLPPALNGAGELQNNFTYDPGVGGQIVVVRAFYEWDIVAKIPGAGLGNMGNGNRLMTATAAFRNEPF